MTGSTKLPTSEWVSVALADTREGEGKRRLIALLYRIDEFAKGGHTGEVDRFAHLARTAVDQYRDYAVNGPDRLTLDSPIEDLGIEGAAIGILENYGLSQIYDLHVQGESTVASHEGVGDGTMQELRDGLRKHGFTFWG